MSTNTGVARCAGRADEHEHAVRRSGIWPRSSDEYEHSVGHRTEVVTSGCCVDVVRSQVFEAPGSHPSFLGCLRDVANATPTKSAATRQADLRRLPSHLRGRCGVHTPMIGGISGTSWSTTPMLGAGDRHNFGEVVVSRALLDDNFPEVVAEEGAEAATGWAERVRRRRRPGRGGC